MFWSTGRISTSIRALEELIPTLRIRPWKRIWRAELQRMRRWKWVTHFRGSREFAHHIALDIAAFHGAHFIDWLGLRLRLRLRLVLGMGLDLGLSVRLGLGLCLGLGLWLGLWLGLELELRSLETCRKRSWGGTGW